MHCSAARRPGTRSAPFSWSPVALLQAPPLCLPALHHRMTPPPLATSGTAQHPPRCFSASRRDSGLSSRVATNARTQSGSVLE